MAAARQSLVWHGEAITEKMRAAQKAGVNATMGACVVEAKSSHAWQNRTGTLEGGINIADYAREDGAGVVGVWGVSDVVYALIHELGGTITAKNKPYLMIPQADGSFRQVKSVTLPARPYLRPAADKMYPSLGDRIRRAYDGQAERTFAPAFGTGSAAFGSGSPHFGGSGG